VLTKRRVKPGSFVGIFDLQATSRIRRRPQHRPDAIPMERLALTELVLPEDTGRFIPSTVIIGTSGFCKKDLPVIDLVPPLPRRK
jgi:hypothetical protein